MIFIVLEGLVFKDMAPFRGSFISWPTFCTDPPYILNCRHAKNETELRSQIRRIS